jgi:hypothetical protein
MKPELWGHQRNELDNYYDDPSRGLLWSMRSGKSRVIIESACRLHREGRITGLLATAPNGVHAQWISRQFPLWATGPIGEMLAWRSSSTSPADVDRFLKDPEGLHVLTVNVEALQIKRVQDIIRRFLKLHGGGDTVMAVFDESHDFRSPGARRTRLARGLARRCKFRRILTGTASDNSPLHLFSQFELLQPCALGHRTYSSFKAHHAEYREQRRADGRSYPQLTGYRNLEELRDWASLWASVVTRAQADVPEVLLTERVVQLSSPQRRAYDDLARDALRIDAEGEGEIEVRKHLMKMQQVLGGFVHFNDTYGNHVHAIKGPIPRIKAMVEEVLGSEPLRVIVWCRFREDIRLCCLALREAEVRVVEYHGGVSDDDKEAAIAALQDGPAPIVFVGQPQAAGQGLDLSAASTVIWYSHVYGDAIVREQASARASVKGGDRVVMVDLVAEDTLDIGMLEALHDKAELGDRLTGNGLAELLAGGSPALVDAGPSRIPVNEFSQYDSSIESTGLQEPTPRIAEEIDMAQRKAATKKPVAKKKATKKTPAKPKGPTISDTARKAIKAGATNAEALATVKAAHPDAKTTMASVAWYRNDMRKAGQKVKTSREISAARRAKEKKAKAAEDKKS